MRIRNEQDFWSGVMFIAFGLFFVVFAQNYDFGNARRMGPAYFPTILGAILLALGILIALKALVTRSVDGKLEKFHFGPLLWVLGAICAFGLLLRPAGLVVAFIALIGISSMGSHEFRWKEIVLLTAGLGLLVLVVFIWGLGLTIPVWPAFLQR